MRFERIVEEGVQLATALFIVWVSLLVTVGPVLLVGKLLSIPYEAVGLLTIPALALGVALAFRLRRHAPR